MQILLALAAHRSSTCDSDVTRLMCDGHLEEAVKLGAQRVLRCTAPYGTSVTELAPLLGRALLLLGNEEAAEEQFQGCAKLYAGSPRPWIRWMSSLDHGWMCAYRNRTGRAVESFRVVCEDPASPALLKIEAFACMASAMQSRGECGRAASALAEARSLAQELKDTRALALIECCELEHLALQLCRLNEELADHAWSAGYRADAHRLPEPVLVRQRLAEAERHFAGNELVVQRLNHLRMLITPLPEGNVAGCLAWLRERRMMGVEMGSRIEAALALLAKGAVGPAREVLSPLTSTERGVRHGRFSLEILYCLSKMYLTQGQHLDSLEMYKRHMEQALSAVKRDLTQISQAKLDDGANRLAEPDSAMLRLPVRYRSAYQFILDNLSDPQLSVCTVAVHIGVTVRALQLVFRSHLGLSPTECIRRERVKRIHDELSDRTQGGGRPVVSEVASQWGMTNRSTLIQSYRSLFAETPSDTLRGGDRTVVL